MINNPFTELSGSTLKDQGQARVLSNTPKDWKSRATGIVERLAHDCESFTMDDIRTAAGMYGLIDPPSPNAWGALMTSLRREGLIKQTGGYVKSNHPSNHSRIISVWERA